MAQLNEELICLLVDFCAVDKEFRKFLVKKDLSFFYLRHTAYAELAGLKPVDYAWGRFTTLGLEQMRLLTWNVIREEYIKNELLVDFGMMDIDMAFGYFYNRLSNNIKTYNSLLSMKYSFEVLDMERAGIKGLSYIDRVHYRTFAGHEIILRYGHYHSIVNRLTIDMYNGEFDRVLSNYKFIIEDSKGFVDDFKERLEQQLEERRRKTRLSKFRDGL